MKKLLFLLPLLSLFFFVACSGKHPADVIAPTIMIGTDVYQGLEDTLVRLHDAGAPTIVDRWQDISNARWKASKGYRAAWKAWYTLSLVNNPQNQTELNTQIAALADLLTQLLSFIPTKDPAFSGLQAGIQKMKEDANVTR